MQFQGVIPILVTPFDSDESVDLGSIAMLVNFMRELQVEGVTILGVLGEANRLTDAERAEIISSAVEHARGLPIIVGTSASGTKAVIELNRMASSLGASAVMITPHAEPTPSEERIFQHFADISEDTKLPIILQDHPASTGVHMSVDLIVKLIEQLPNIVGLKLEAVPTAPKLIQIRKQCARHINIMTGLGGLYGIFDLRAGSDGFNTGFAFPEVLQAMVSASKNNDWSTALKIYQRFSPMLVLEQQPGVAIRKRLLLARGVISHASVRKPGASLNPSLSDEIDYLIETLLPEQDITQRICIPNA